MQIERRRPLEKPKPDDREWRYELCDCCDAWGTRKLNIEFTRLDKSSLFCAPSVIAAQGVIQFCFSSLQAIIEQREATCGDVLAAFFAPWCINKSNRNKIREKYRIEGTNCSDCVLSCFCLSLVLTQQTREMRYEGEAPTTSCMEDDVIVQTIT
jgi:Cys-rich protein (TIGR01571 family)